MKILNITLQNFKGIRYFNLNTQGKDANVFGDNAVGKTTLADAFMWLLFDKDSQNRKDFEIKTLGHDGEPEHGLDHSVEAILELEDAGQLALKKVFSEKWTKKRGSAIAEFTGHTTDYFIDGVPVQKKEYDARISEIADEQIFRLLTDPRYFNEILHWQKRREMLLEVCGDVSESEVIASNKDLSKLSDILGSRTIDQHRKVIQARRTEINRELERIPVRIDEVQRNLPDVSDINNENELTNDINKLRDELRAKQEGLIQARAGGQVAEMTKKLRQCEAQALDMVNEHRKALDEKTAGKRAMLQAVQSNIYRLKALVDSINRTIQLTESEIRSFDDRMEDLRNKWRVENAREFTFDQQTVCPTCGQALPEDRLQSAREKALADFNRSKAERLESINADGKRLKEAKCALENDLANARVEIEKTKRELAENEQKEATIKAEIDTVMQNPDPVEGSLQYAKLQEQMDAIRNDIKKAENDNYFAISAIQAEIDDISSAIRSLEQAQARLETRKNSLQRIEDLKSEERKLATEYEDLESQLFLTEEFIRAKVRMLEDRINSKFRMARFKLFEVQINGALAECCETTYNGVPYSNLNNGARLNIGLDIINTLADHYGFTPPVWLDNAESVTDILPTRGQQIRLIVSAPDKKLRVELAEREELREAI